MHELLRTFDRVTAQYIALLPSWLHPIMTTATLVGEPVVIISLALLTGIIAWTRGQYRIAYAEVAALTGFGINTALKFIFHRTRPHTIFVENMRIKSYSFPSGHAYGGLVIYGLLAYLAHKYLPHPWNSIVAAGLTILTFIIGISRVYLGAHFPSDVLAGWLFGAVTLLLIILWIKP